ncbi:hypothetical protein C8Q80DRAFT_647396 [Daedaleopsis nitida]|nr:hypothetical protein C8Q80DRAFT_647396 [Daedaleopsis nitida]
MSTIPAHLSASPPCSLYHRSYRGPCSFWSTSHTLSCSLLEDLNILPAIRSSLGPSDIATSHVRSTPLWILLTLILPLFLFLLALSATQSSYPTRSTSETRGPARRVSAHARCIYQRQLVVPWCTICRSRQLPCTLKTVSSSLTPQAPSHNVRPSCQHKCQSTCSPLLPTAQCSTSHNQMTTALSPRLFRLHVHTYLSLLLTSVSAAVAASDSDSKTRPWPGCGDGHTSVRCERGH